MLLKDLRTIGAELSAHFKSVAGQVGQFNPVKHQNSRGGESGPVLADRRLLSLSRCSKVLRDAREREKPTRGLNVCCCLNQMFVFGRGGAQSVYHTARGLQGTRLPS